MKRVCFFVILGLLAVCLFSSVFAISEAGEIGFTDVTERDDGNFSVEIFLDTDMVIEHMELDIVLPVGFDLYSYVIDNRLIGRSELIQSQQKYSFIFRSVDGEAFEGRNTLLKLTLTGEKSITDGEYEIKTENCRIIDADKSTYYLSDAGRKFELSRLPVPETASPLPTPTTPTQQECSHQFDGWTVIKAPTYDTVGERVKICIKCNKTCKTSVIAKIQKRDITLARTAYNESVVYTGKALTPPISLTYKGIPMNEDTDYTVTYSANKSVGTGTVTVNGIGAYEGERTFSFKIKPRKVTGLKLKSRTSSSVTLKWNKLDEADKYLVYVYQSGKWKKIGDTEKAYFKVKGLSSGKKYKFKLCAQKKNIKGSKSSTFSVYTKPDSVKIKSVKAQKGDKVKMNWDKAKGCDGYIIYVKKPDSNKFRSLKTIKSPIVTTYTTKMLAADGKYSFKIRSYVSSEKGKIFSSYSRVKYMNL